MRIRPLRRSTPSASRVQTFGEANSPRQPPRRLDADIHLAERAGGQDILPLEEVEQRLERCDLPLDAPFGQVAEELTDVLAQRRLVHRFDRLRGGLSASQMLGELPEVDAV